MEKTKSKCGYVVYAATADETHRLGGMGICDYCGKAAETGYLIPVLNSYYCHECYDEWDSVGKYYPEDIAVQNRVAEYYESRIPMSGDNKNIV